MIYYFLIYLLLFFYFIKRLINPIINNIELMMHIIIPQGVDIFQDNNVIKLPDIKILLSFPIIIFKTSFKYKI